MPTKIVADHDMIDLGGLHISISERHGKIKAIFGQPIYETENLGNLFLYRILTTSDEGEEIYLEIYCAGSGPAVGGGKGFSKLCLAG